MPVYAFRCVLDKNSGRFVGKPQLTLQRNKKKQSLSLNVQTNPCITTSQTVRKLSIYKNWPQRHKKIPQ